MTFATRREVASTTYLKVLELAHFFRTGKITQSIMFSETLLRDLVKSTWIVCSFSAPLVCKKIDNDELDLRRVGKFSARNNS